MTIRLNPRWLLVSLLFFTLQFSRAQVIVVPPTLSFDLGPDVAEESQLWDLNGSYVVNILVEGNKGLAEPVQIAFTLIQTPGGKLTTTTNDLVNASIVFNNDDNSAFVATAKISGKVNGFAGTARAHFTVRFSGNGNLGGKATSISGSFTVDAETDPSGQLVGTKLSKFSSTCPNLLTIKGKGEFATDLPPGSDGSWNLTMRLVGINKLTGTGIITTSSEALGLDLTSKFNGLLVTEAKGSAGVPNTVSGVGCSGTILVPTTFDTVQFKGKLLGQKMSFNVTTPAPE